MDTNISEYLASIHFTPNGNCYYDNPRRYPDLDLFADSTWSHQTHLKFGRDTNDLFTTLFLAIQRLEEQQILPLAHQAMFEDMLTLWKVSDIPPVSHLAQIQYLISLSQPSQPKSKPHRQSARPHSKFYKTLNYVAKVFTH